MISEALIGFLGVALGSLTTSILTIYRERVASLRELQAREHLREREQRDRRAIFQRESLLALQEALAALTEAVYAEQDLMIQHHAQKGEWPTRTWWTRTAENWQPKALLVEALSARVFDDDLRRLALQARAASRTAVWAQNSDDAESANTALGEARCSFNLRVSTLLPTLY